jgi:hypothetical protein
LKNNRKEAGAEWKINSVYWLRLVFETKLADKDLLEELLGEAIQLRAILSKAVSTTKKKGV